MSERGQFRGGRGGGGGRGGRGGARGGGNNNAAHSGGAEQPRPKKENILDLNKYMDKEIMVKFSGGREGRSIFACSLLFSFFPSIIPFLSPLPTHCCCQPRSLHALTCTFPTAQSPDSSKATINS